MGDWRESLESISKAPAGPLTRVECPPIPKRPEGVKVKSRANKVLVRSLPCCNPNCPNGKTSAGRVKFLQTDAHHLDKRSQGGDDKVRNLAPLCDDCHMEVHAHPGLYPDELLRAWAAPDQALIERYIGQDEKKGDGV